MILGEPDLIRRTCRKGQALPEKGSLKQQAYLAGLEGHEESYCDLPRGQPLVAEASGLQPQETANNLNELEKDPEFPVRTPAWPTP